MYDKVFEQAGSFFKPMAEIFELNAEAFDAIRTKQADIVNELMADSIAYAKDVAKPNMDIDSFVETQTAYWEGIRSKLTSNAQDSYEVLSDTQGKVGELLQGAFDANFGDLSSFGDLSAFGVTPTASKPASTAKKKPAAKKASPKAKAAKAAPSEESADA